MNRFDSHCIVRTGTLFLDSTVYKDQVNKGHGKAKRKKHISGSELAGLYHATFQNPRKVLGKGGRGSRGRG